MEGSLMEPMRLNKFLSDRGICSRREADRLADEGRISVNGRPAEKGQRVMDADEIRINGKPVAMTKPEKVIIALWKPVGVVSTTRGFKDEKKVTDLVDYPGRLYPVGRLDKDSEGLIFLTNDGAFAEEVTRASGRHEKEYEVVVNKELTTHFLERMEKGVFLEELNKETAACRVTKQGTKRFTIILTQGLNRQIRRMCQTLGYDVLSLKRVRIMNVTLEGLKPGEWRKLEGDEKKLLEDYAYRRKTPPSPKREGRAASNTAKEQRKLTAKTKDVLYTKGLPKDMSRKKGGAQSKFIPASKNTTSKSPSSKGR
ncbi:MAG: pseudouridine synthase [Lachnospiraceae bacterium]|nr:pseudouridine synthase [Lachnospiraceae bacterium]